MKKTAVVLLGWILLVSGAASLPEDTGKHVDTLGELLGTDRDRVVAWLSQHENDDYYLGTGFPAFGHPWTPAWCARPNGIYAGNHAQMNCTGFVTDVLLHSGVPRRKLIDVVGFLERTMDFESDYGYIDATCLYLYGTGVAGIRYYVFGSIAEALASGKLRKGDLVYFDPKEYSVEEGYDIYGNEADCHIGFFWGNRPNENRFWHSTLGGSVGVPGAQTVVTGNQISELSPCSDSYVVVFPLADLPAIDRQTVLAGRPAIRCLLLEKRRELV